jgi:hypothetical protein
MMTRGGWEGVGRSEVRLGSGGYPRRSTVYACWTQLGLERRCCRDRQALTLVLCFVPGSGGPGGLPAQDHAESQQDEDQEAVQGEALHQVHQLQPPPPHPVSWLLVPLRCGCAAFVCGTESLGVHHWRLLAIVNQVVNFNHPASRLGDCEPCPLLETNPRHEASGWPRGGLATIVVGTDGRVDPTLMSPG